MTKTSGVPSFDSEVEPQLGQFTSEMMKLTKRYKLTKAWIDEHPEPNRVELVTRGPAAVPTERHGKIVDHLHWRYAGLRADDIMHGNAAADGGYMPLTLEGIAEGESSATSMKCLQEDVEVIAIELLGLLWRLEDTGVIRHTETIVEAGGL